MKKRLLLALLTPLAVLCASAQTLQIKGHVTDDTSSAGLSNVSVVVVETKKGVSTDANGNFSLTVIGRRSVSLLVSFIGYGSQTITTNGSSPVTIALRKEQVSAGDEVVVVGYTTVRRKDLTGSVSSVGAKQLRDIPLVSAAEAITGRLAGVQVTTSEGAPGADIRIRVRGGGSISQDNSPIYIVDGVQVENALQLLSPQDIASIDVLKDASTTAIYGARGANGVVIITTKGGRGGKTTVTYNGSFGVRKIFKKLDVLSPYDFVNWQYERSRNPTDSASFARNYGTTWDTLKNYQNASPVDWQGQVFGRSANYQTHNVSVSGGSQTTTFNLSVTNNQEEGVMLASGLSRNLLSFKLDHRASDKFRIGFNARYLDQVVKGAGTTGGSNNIRNSIQYRPYESPNAVVGVDEFDEQYLTESGLYNPIVLSSAEYRMNYTKSLNLNATLSYKIFKDITFRSTAGYDIGDGRSNAFNGRITSTARQYGSMPTATIRTSSGVTINNSNTLTYARNNIRDVHNVEFLVGEETYQTKSTSLGLETRYLPVEIAPEKALAQMKGTPPPGQLQPLPTAGTGVQNKIISYFGRLNYSYDNKYLATISVRSDRSSKFAPENGALVFPSGSFAWRFSQEKFMKGLSFLSDGKVRFGYGTAGNNRIGDLLYLPLYSVSGEYALGDALYPALTPSSLANKNIRWEKTISKNFGLDLGFFKNRLQITTDVYFNRTKDLLLDLAIPPTSGYASQINNIGATSNNGVEFQITGNIVQKKDFSWTVNFNNSFNTNKILSLGPIQSNTISAGWQGSDGANDFYYAVGKPVGLMYGFITDGFYKVEDFNYTAATNTYTLKAGQPNTINVFGNPQPGTIKLKNLAGDSLISLADDRAVLGNANPKFIGGLNQQFTYKNFDFSLFINWVVGNDVYNANKIVLTDGYRLNQNLLAVMKDRWRTVDESGKVVTDPGQLAKMNVNAQIWRPITNNRPYLHSWAIEDGSFLRVNNLTIGYTISPALSQKVKISNARVYATVNNLATITNYSGYDPEVNTRRGSPLTPGVDYSAYPRSRAFVFGLNVTF